MSECLGDPLEHSIFKCMHIFYLTSILLNPMANFQRNSFVGLAFKVIMHFFVKSIYLIKRMKHF